MVFQKMLPMKKTKKKTNIKAVCCFEYVRTGVTAAALYQSYNAGGAGGQT